MRWISILKILFVFLLLSIVSCKKEDNNQLTAEVIHENVVVENENVNQPENEETILEQISEKTTNEVDEFIDEGIQLNCTAIWKCTDDKNRGFQNSDCSWGETEQCEFACDNGLCMKPKLCEAFKKRCSNDNLESCDETGLSYNVEKRCVYGCEKDRCLGIDNATIKLMVNKVRNSDEIRLSTGDTVFLIGIKAPLEDPLRSEARNWLETQILNKEIQIENDKVLRTDSNDLLRYVFLDGINLNVWLVSEGLASLNIIEPNVKYKNDLEQAYLTCVANKKNLCYVANLTINATMNSTNITNPSLSNVSNCEKSCLKLDVHFDADGNDCQNLNDEYATIKNECDKCQLSGWKLKDDSTRNPYDFSNIEISKDHTIKIFTGCGTNNEDSLFWCSSGEPCNAIWNNDEDSALLYDKDNKLTLNYTYS